MMRRFRLPGTRVKLLLVALFVVAVAGAVGGTYAVFVAEAGNQTSTFAGGWIGRPTGLGTPTPSGYDVQFAWTPATHGLTGQQLWAYDNGAQTPHTCSGATYTQLSTMASATTSSYTQSNTSTLRAHWLCYEMVSTSASTWTAAAQFSGLQIGLVANSITVTAGGTLSGKISTGDVITIVFNQAPTGIATGSRSVCVNPGANSNVVILGDTSGCVSSSDANDVGVISGYTITGGGGMGATAAMNCNASNFSLSGSTLTITIGDTLGAMGSLGPCDSANAATETGTGTYTPANTILSAATTDQAQICTGAANGCRPTVSGSF